MKTNKLLLGLCATALLCLGFTASTNAQKAIDLEGQFKAAVADAAKAEQAEVSTTLSCIGPANPNLMRDDQGRVLVVTWTNYKYVDYDSLAGKDYTFAWGETWVTLAPEMKDFCTALAWSGSEDALTLRLEQLLGLPPHNGKSQVVEMWVNPADLYRPCPDPEIDDCACTLENEGGAYDCAPEAFTAWYENLKGESYGEGGYPWTRLGYTYDWGNPNSEVGLSEYVLVKGATARIHSSSKTTAYCGGK